jgi:hypothetical protein
MYPTIYCKLRLRQARRHPRCRRGQRHHACKRAMDSSEERPQRCLECTRPVRAHPTPAQTHSLTRALRGTTGDYDIACFAVGAVERTQFLPQDDVRLGDVLLGLPFTGLHANAAGPMMTTTMLDRALVRHVLPAARQSHGAHYGRRLRGQDNVPRARTPPLAESSSCSSWGGTRQTGRRERLWMQGRTRFTPLTRWCRLASLGSRYSTQGHPETHKSFSFSPILITSLP